GRRRDRCRAARLARSEYAIESPRGKEGSTRCVHAVQPCVARLIEAERKDGARCVCRGAMATASRLPVIPAASALGAAEDESKHPKNQPDDEQQQQNVQAARE